ncbi:MAG: NYN domain-containing protein [Luteitalea sp.]|nr:NYN domain-containing protein [Luteitalea sp.]
MFGRRLQVKGSRPRSLLLPPRAHPPSRGSALPHQERVNIAVFIDFDNIEIGVKTTLGEHFDIGVILEALKERGEVVTKIAYAD